MAKIFLKLLGEERAIFKYSLVRAYVFPDPAEALYILKEVFDIPIAKYGI